MAEYIDILIDSPIYLELGIGDPTNITTTLSGPTGQRGTSAYEIALIYGYNGTEEEWINSLNSPEKLTGIKTTGIDAGIIHQQSITPEYLYYCIQTGDSDTAIWGMIPITSTI